MSKNKHLFIPNRSSGSFKMVETYFDSSNTRIEYDVEFTARESAIVTHFGSEIGFLKDRITMLSDTIDVLQQQLRGKANGKTK
jgi:hypothetical protein